MPGHPVCEEVGAALGAFVTGAVGPTHSKLSTVFTEAGYGAAAPYDRFDDQQQPNKEDRVNSTVRAAIRSPQRSRDLVDGLLAQYRAHGFFRPSDNADEEKQRARRVRAAQAASARIDWELTDDGELHPLGVAAVTSVKGRPAIDDQLKRLRRATDDPALLIGTAKEMLESTAKYVLDAFSWGYSAKTSFDELWHHARDRLGIHPKDIDVSQPGGAEVREILESSWKIARMCNELRNVEGTGHGRTLPAAVSPATALLVVREACSIVQMTLSELDHQTGR